MANTVWTFLLRMQGDARQLEYAMGIAEKRMSGFEGTMVRVGRTLSATGRAMTIGVTVPLAIVGGAAIKAAMDWETSWTSVVKTVDDGTKQVHDQLQVLQKDLIEMSKQIPVSVNDLNEIAAAGGALGIPVNELDEFTKVVAELGATTNLTIDAAANALGHLHTLMQLTSGDMTELGSILVDLGNKGASTESEILGMTTAIAGAGKIIGLTMPQTLGWAAALANVGEETQAGGTSLQRFFLMSAQMIHAGGKELSTFAKIAGMSAKSFARYFDTDASSALQLFLDKLGAMPAKAQQATLGLLGFTDVRITRALLKLLANTNNLDSALGLAAKDAQEFVASGGAINYMNQEFQRRVDTLASQLKIFFNTVYAIGIELGETLYPVLKEDVLPVLYDVAHTVEGWVKAFEHLDPQTRKFIIKAALIAAALGPVLIVVGSLVSAFGGLLSILRGFGAVTLKGVAKILALFGVGKGVAGGGVVGKVLGLAGQRVFVTNWPPGMLLPGGGGKVEPPFWLPQAEKNIAKDAESAAETAAAAAAGAESKTVLGGLRSLLNRIPLMAVAAVDIAAVVGVVLTWFKVNGDIQTAVNFESGVVSQRQKAAGDNLAELVKLQKDLEAQIAAGGGDPLASLLKAAFVNPELIRQLNDLKEQIRILEGRQYVPGQPINTGPAPAGTRTNTGYYISDYASRHPTGVAAMPFPMTADYGTRHPTGPAPKISAQQFLKTLATSPFMGPKAYKSVWEKFSTDKTTRDIFGTDFLTLLKNLKNPKDPKVLTEINGHIDELKNLEQYYLDHGDTVAAAKVQEVVDQIVILTGMLKPLTPVTKKTHEAIVKGQQITGHGFTQLADGVDKTATASNSITHHVANLEGIDKVSSDYLNSIKGKKWSATLNAYVTVPISETIIANISGGATKVVSTKRQAAGKGIPVTADVLQRGAWEIPSNNYLALLHKGEAVLPPTEASRFRSMMFDMAMNKSQGNGNGPTVGAIHVDARGATDPGAVRAAARRGVQEASDAIAQVMRDQTYRGTSG